MAIGSVETIMAASPITGMESPIARRSAIQPSMTDISSFRHSSTVAPAAQTPSSSGTSPKTGNVSSISLYSALSRAAWMYSANVTAPYP